MNGTVRQTFIFRRCIAIRGAPNNSFNRSANSAAFIVNLNLSASNARPVNSGVRCLILVDEYEATNITSQN
jgi:hypothetical protein